MPIRHSYGHIRDVITHDHLLSEPEMFMCKRMQHHPNLQQIMCIDLRKKCPPVYDQGDLGSCTANALCAAYRYEMMRQKEKDINMSRLFLYYCERALEKTINEDGGAQLKSGIMVLKNTGVCIEKLWPYLIEKFTVKPTPQCYMNAKLHHTLKVQKLSQDLDDLKQSLVDGFPFVFGFVVYKSFESQEVANTGIMQMPQKDEEVAGGHAVMAVGFDNSQNSFIVRNSWGTDWGINGYFYMPFGYVTDDNLAFDFWALQLVKDN